MGDSQFGVYNNVEEVKVVKTEPAILENLPNTLFNSNNCETKLEYLQTDDTLTNNNDLMSMEDYAFLCSLANDDCPMSPSDFDCDIVNLDLRTSETHIQDMLEINSPESWTSSRQSVQEPFSIDSRPSTTNTLSTTQSFNENCAICNDLASGKHYGVSACEGCKGFFKRTIRKKLKFSCREVNNCPMTEKLRNRCQSCRFRKCLEKGMKIEAVQKERPAKPKPSLSDSSGISSPEFVITADSIFRNEMASSNSRMETQTGQVLDVGGTRLLCSILNDQLFHLVMWAKSVPGFDQLVRGDQMILLNKSWVEIFLASMAFRSISNNDSCSLRMDETYRLTLPVATNFGIRQLFIRILRELATPLRRLRIDKMEMACLKIIMLFDPKYSELKQANTVRGYRVSMFEILKKYSTDKYPKQASRLYKLLLKLSSIRGLTAGFVERVRHILKDCVANDKASSDPGKESAELLYPLLTEMIQQQGFPFS